MITAIRSLTGILAAAALAAPALAQSVSFDGRAAFRGDHVNSTTPTISDGSDFSPFGGGGQPPPITLNFALMLGGFDAQGFDNQGMFAWRGNITVTGGDATIGNAPGTRSPFTFSPVANGTVSPDGRTISNIDLVRAPLVTLPWPAGEPAPEPVFTQGNDAYFSAFRFTITLNTLDFDQITVTATGEMEVVRDWMLLSGEVGDTATYVAGHYVTDSNVGAHFTMAIPAPAAAPLLGLAGLLAARRRRS